MSRTLLQIVESVADALNARSYGTATGGAAGTITCATYPFLTSLANADANEYVGDEIYTSGGTGLGQARQVVTYAPTTGVLTPSANWTVTPDATTTFDIFKRGLRHDWLKDRVNAALVKLRYVTIIPLTLVADGDMETSGVGSWTASNATLTKVTAAANLLHGAQALKALCTNVNGYAASVTINCQPNETFILQARVVTAVGTATLQAYDVTNSAAIDSEDYTYPGFGGLSFTFATPSTCKQIQIRLKGTGATDDAFWDDVQLLRQGDTEVNLPSSIVRAGQVLDVLTDVNRDDAFQDKYHSYFWWKVLPNFDNPNSQFRLSLSPAVNGPIWLKVALPYATLSADTSTTFCDRELIEVASLVETLSGLVNLAPGEEAVAYKVEYLRQRKKLVALRSALQPPPVFRHEFGSRPNTPVSVGY